MLCIIVYVIVFIWFCEFFHCFLCVKLLVMSYLVYFVVKKCIIFWVLFVIFS